MRYSRGLEWGTVMVLVRGGVRRRLGEDLRPGIMEGRTLLVEEGE